MEKAVKKDYSEETPVIQREVLEYNGYQISSCAVDATDIISQVGKITRNKLKYILCVPCMCVHTILHTNLHTNDSTFSM